MSWTQDNLTSVEKLLFASAAVKVGDFVCAADHPCFAVSESLDNDVFVMPKMPVWVSRDDGDFRFVEPGAIVMHRAGQTLSRRQAADAGEKTYWFGVHPDIFLDALLRHELPTDRMGGALLLLPQFRYRVAQLIRRLEIGMLDRLTVEESVLELFFDICALRAKRQQRIEASHGATKRRQRRLVDRARAYIDANLNTNIGLETVAAAAGTSLYHLCRVFRRQTGLTMHAYRTQQRLWHVTEHLLQGDGENLTNLALEQGFSSHSHLSRVFQKQMGLSPSALRNREGRQTCVLSRSFL